MTPTTTEQQAPVRARVPRAASAFGNTYLFAGRRFDAPTGLYYYRNRYGDPRSGRFVGRDPAGYVDGLNLYALTRNNVLNRLDPLGLNCVECRLKVVYSGWSWLSYVTKYRFYSTSSLVKRIPSAIDRGYVQELSLKRIELQARVKSKEPPCCGTANAQGTITAVKEMPDLNNPRLNLVAAALAILSQFSTNIEGSIKTKKLPKIGGPFTAAALFHLFALSAIEFELKRSGHTKSRSQKLDGSWRTIVADFNLGRIPTTKAVDGKVTVGGKTVCKITRLVGS